MADALWAALDLTTWGAPYGEWSGRHPEIKCRQFRGATLAELADREWCERCAEVLPHSKAEWSFYAFNLEEPLISRLEQFDASTDTSSLEILEGIQRILAQKISARYIAGEDLGPRMPRARVVPWPERVRWRAGDLEIRHRARREISRRVSSESLSSERASGCRTRMGDLVVAEPILRRSRRPNASVCARIATNWR